MDALDTCLSSLPADLRAAVLADAELDADRVGRFLTDLGLVGTPEQPLALPETFLEQIATALRLMIWEAQGFSFHREAGLPSGLEAMQTAFRSLVWQSEQARELTDSVFRLSIERFAWHGRPELGADISLGNLQKDVFLEALADFLWAARPK